MTGCVSGRRREARCLAGHSPWAGEQGIPSAETPADAQAWGPASRLGSSRQSSGGLSHNPAPRIRGESQLPPAKSPPKATQWKSHLARRTGRGWQDTGPLKEACPPQPGLSSLSAEGTVGSTPRAWQGVGRRPWEGSCRDFQGWALQGPLGRVQRWSSTCREGGRGPRAQPQYSNARSLWVAGVPCSHVALGKLSMSPG